MKIAKNSAFWHNLGKAKDIKHETMKVTNIYTYICLSLSLSPVISQIEQFWLSRYSCFYLGSCIHELVYQKIVNKGQEIISKDFLRLLSIVFMIFWYWSEHPTFPVLVFLPSSYYVWYIMLPIFVDAIGLLGTR